MHGFEYFKYIIEILNTDLEKLIMKIAVYPGTFDPIHNGHIDVLERASKMFDKIYIVIAVNSKKDNLFSKDERIEMAKLSLKHLKNVEAVFHSGLLVDYARNKNAIALIRGLRTVTDFDYEMQIAAMNRQLSEISTIFLMPDEKYSYLNSSIIREISKYGQDTSKFVPNLVKVKLEEKFKNNN